MKRLNCGCLRQLTAALAGLTIFMEAGESVPNTYQPALEAAAQLEWLMGKDAS